jgi:hypothetical protein
VGATKPLRVMQASWSSPVTSRLLLDAGFGGVYYGWGSFERDPNPTRGLTRVTEQCAAGCADNGGIAGLVYRDLYNALNTGAILTYNNTYAPPTATGRAYTSNH